MKEFMISFDYNDRNYTARVIKIKTSNGMEYHIRPRSPDLVQQFGEQIEITWSESQNDYSAPDRIQEHSELFAHLVRAIQPFRQNKEDRLRSDSFDKEEGEQFPGYPPYPIDEDIYSQDVEEADVDPIQTDIPKQPNHAPPKEGDSFRVGDDLDIPGAELDDPDERVGDEDEENNYYSLNSEVEEQDRDAEE